MKNLYVVVEKGSNRAIALMDSESVQWHKQHMKTMDILPVSNIGSSMRVIYGFLINSISILVEIDETNDKHYYIITDWPESMTLEEAYSLIK